MYTAQLYVSNPEIHYNDKPPTIDFSSLVYGYVGNPVIPQLLYPKLYTVSKQNLWMTTPPLLLANGTLSTYPQIITPKLINQEPSFISVMGLYGIALFTKGARYTNLFMFQKYLLAADIMVLTCDVLVTSALCYLLHKTRSQVRATRGVLNRLFFNVLNRGGFNLILTILMIVFLRLNTKAYMFTVVFYPGGEGTSPNPSYDVQMLICFYTHV
ncbi:hypothetical protein VKT23_014745 [Stygiomarasmius scandens]|uniref:DUF6534 domain-containing protein n=1 Tax=Marasmiellus scandens TaxID=2682957 RepID=A0ABR1J234_9AGAR